MKTALEAPPHHVDLVFSRGCELLFYGPSANDWLDRSLALPLLQDALRTTRSEHTSWWFSLSALSVRCVALQGEAPAILVTVVPPRPELVEALEFLTPKQREVAEYAAAGATVAEIARATGRHPETVRSHIKNIYERLSICTRLELSWLLRRPAISYDT